MKQYPVILFPRASAQVQEAIPSALWFNEQSPQHPGEKPQRVNSDLVVACGAIVAIVSMVVAFAFNK